METPEYIAGLRIVGGHLALDFINTVDGEPRLETLRGYEDLVAWSVRLGLLSADEGGHLVSEANRKPEEAEAVYLDALGLRDTLYGIFCAVAENEDPPSESLEILREFEVKALSRGRLVRDDDGFGFEWTDGEDLARVLWPVAHAAVGLLASGGLARLKRCAGCHWLFLDASRNRSRRWCTMEVCGTHEKARRYVEKRADRRDSQPRGDA